jgi:hypothetical protein
VFSRKNGRTCVEDAAKDGALGSARNVGDEDGVACVSLAAASKVDHAPLHCMLPVAPEQLHRQSKLSNGIKATAQAIKVEQWNKSYCLLAKY